MAANVRKNGPYAPLGANYADDDAITTLDVSEDDRAELLFLRAMAYCARDPRTEGFVSDVALKAGRVLRRKPGRKGVDTITLAADTLVDLRLWTRVSDGYQITSWLKWNKSWEEISHGRQTDAARKRSQAVEESEPTPSGVQAESEPTPKRLVPPNHVTSVHGTSQHITPPAKPARTRSDKEPDGFAEWYLAYPLKKARPDAARAYAKAVKVTDAETLMQGAVRYARERQGQDPAYTSHPASWLNARRWEDEAAPVQRPMWDNFAPQDPSLMPKRQTP